MKTAFYEAGEIDNQNPAGWYVRDDNNEFHGPFFSREAAQDEALILEMVDEHERRHESRHNRSLMGPQ